MNRAPVEGDVIVVGRQERVVIFAQRNEPMKNYVFLTIKRDDLGKVNPKQEWFQLIGGISQHKEVALTEVGFIEQIKLKVKTEITYFQK